MKSLALFTISLCLISCASIDRPTDTSIKDGLLKNQVIKIDGDNRQYHLYLPAKTEDAAVVVLLHGHGGSSNQILGIPNKKSPFKLWLDVAERDNIILVIPNGNISPDNFRGWNDCRADAENNPISNDLLFIDKLLDKVVDEYNPDENRIYINGISNGGHMTQLLAEAIPHRLAAVAVIVSSRPANRKCSDSDIPLSILFMNGTEDTFVPYDGGDIIDNRGEVYSTDETINYWIAKNKTDKQPIVTEFSNSNKVDRSTVTQYTYENGVNGTEVVLYKVDGGGHTEPSIQERYGLIYKGIVGPQNGDIEMVDEVWSFFRDKSSN